jgi:aminoglycoside phosphotransferase (APT) family kinase protein
MTPISTRVPALPSDRVLEAVLAAHLPGASLLGVSALSGGVSADVFRLDVEGVGGALRSVVLRVHGAHHNGHSAALEFAILRSVEGLGICAPRALALDETLSHIAYPYLILDHVDGETVFPDGPSDPKIATMAKALAGVHSASVPTRLNLPMRDDPLPEVFDYLPGGGEFDALRRKLLKIGTTRYDGRAVLLHGDFWPGNLLWRGGDLVAVLDWEDAACGDPLSDVACTALELRYIAGEEGTESFLRAYGDVSPIDRHRLALWQIYVAAAGHHSMGAWGLEAGREAHMRAIALAVIREAGALLV